MKRYRSIKQQRQNGPHHHGVKRKARQQRRRSKRRGNRGCAARCRRKLFDSRPTYKAGARRVVESMFTEAVHHKQVLSLFLVVVGVLCSDRLGIAAVGVAMARTFGTAAKHGKKQVDRFLSNDKLKLPRLWHCLVPVVVGRRSHIWVTMDWTDFDADDQTTLVFSLITSSGRTQPLVWRTVRKSTLKDRQRRYERAGLRDLKAALPPTVGVTIVADRGFGDVKLYHYIWRTLGLHFVIRYRQSIYVREGDWLYPSAMHVPTNGRCRVIRDTTLTAQEAGPYTVVLYKAAGMKEAWCLATSYPVTDGQAIVRIYSRRFRCEETFRDLKDKRFGYGLRLTAIQDTERRDRMLFVFVLAYVIHTLMGKTSEQLGLDRQLRANTTAERTHSLFAQGRALIGEWSHALWRSITDNFRTRLHCFLAEGLIAALT